MKSTCGGTDCATALEGAAGGVESAATANAAAVRIRQPHSDRGVGQSTWFPSAPPQRSSREVYLIM